MMQHEMNGQLHQTLRHYEKLLQFAEQLTRCPSCSQNLYCRDDCALCDTNPIAFLNMQSARHAIKKEACSA